MWDGYIAISICFAVLIAALLWFIVGSRGLIWLKIIVTLLIVWYSTVLYLSVPQVAGWPTNCEPPEGAWIRAIHIQEPIATNPGGIYFWLLTKPPKGKTAAFYLLRPFAFDMPAPRAFALPYSKELHRKILKMQKRKKNTPGSMLAVGKRDKKGKVGKRDKKGKVGKYGTGDPRSTDKTKIKLINPMDLLKKD